MHAVGIHDSLLAMVTEAGRIDGSLAGITAEDIAAECDFDGEPSKLIDALVESGLIDRSSTRKLRVHDFEEYSGSPKENARKSAWSKNSSVRGTTSSRRRSDVKPTDSDVAIHVRTNVRTYERTNEHTDGAPGPTPPPVDQLALVALEPVPADVDPVVVVFEHYRQKHPQAQLDPKRRKLIKQWLSKYSVLSLCQAIDGCHQSTFHAGENDRGKRYLQLEHCLRSAGHIEDFIDLATGVRPKPKPPLRPTTGADDTANAQRQLREQHGSFAAAEIQRARREASGPPANIRDLLPPMLRGGK